MGYFSELDIKIRQYLPNYLTLRLPTCPRCGENARITGFLPERTLFLTCTACDRRVEHSVDLPSGNKPAGTSRTQPNKSSQIKDGANHGRHHSEGD